MNSIFNTTLAQLKKLRQSVLSWVQFSNDKKTLEYFKLLYQRQKDESKCYYELSWKIKKTLKYTDEKEVLDEIKNIIHSDAENWLKTEREHSEKINRFRQKENQSLLSSIWEKEGFV